MEVRCADLLLQSVVVIERQVNANLTYTSAMTQPKRMIKSLLTLNSEPILSA